MDRLKEECGVFGIFDNKDAAALTALGLHALQHRGQEGCGIVTFDGKNFYAERRLGLVGDNFTKKDIIEKNTIIIVETHIEDSFKVIEKLKVFEQRSYGKTSLYFIKLLK